MTLFCIPWQTREQEQSGVIHSANEMRRSLEERLQQHLENHQREVDALKSEIATKEAHISQVSGRYQDQLMAVNELKEELEQTQHNYDAGKELLQHPVVLHPLPPPDPDHVSTVIIYYVHLLLD